MFTSAVILSIIAKAMVTFMVGYGAGKSVAWMRSLTNAA